MINKQGIKFLTESDFDEHSIWRYSESTDLYYPVTLLEEIPISAKNLFIRANLRCPNTMTFKGYIIGAQNIYGVGIFNAGKKYRFNKNALEECIAQFNLFIQKLPFNKIFLISEIFPIRYETTIDLEGFHNVSGEFNAFEKLQEKRLLKEKQF